MFLKQNSKTKIEIEAENFLKKRRDNNKIIIYDNCGNEKVIDIANVFRKKKK